MTRTPAQLRRTADRLYEAAGRWCAEAELDTGAHWLLLSDADAATSEGAGLEALAIWIELHGGAPCLS